MTMMAGPPEAMAQETAYFAALTKVTQFAVTADSLTLTDDEGTVLVRYAVVQPTTLEGTEWDALAYNNGKGALQSLAASSAITATFGSDGSLTGKAGVNRYTTTYATSDGAMTIDAAIATTKMAGPEELMKQEAAYLAALPQTATYTIEGDELSLRDRGRRRARPLRRPVRRSWRPRRRADRRRPAGGRLDAERLYSVPTGGGVAVSADFVPIAQTKSPRGPPAAVSMRPNPASSSRRRTVAPARRE